MTVLAGNLDYVATVLLFVIGVWTLIADPNLIKKVMGLNIMETAVFAFIVTTGVLDPPSPIPHALVLTGIVVAVSTTAVALALLLRVHREFGTLDVNELRDLW